MSSSENSQRAARILEASVEAMPEVERLCSGHRPEHRLCWHFGPPASAWPEQGGDFDDSYLEPAREYAQRHFPHAIIDLVGGPVGIEVLEMICPTETWLRTRVIEMATFADAVGIRLEGWSYEPKGYPGGLIPQAFANQNSEQKQ